MKGLVFPMKTGDKIIFKNDNKLYSRSRAEFPRMITEIVECINKDSACPKSCPGLIQIDNVGDAACYGVEDTGGKYIMSIEKMAKGYKPPVRNVAHEYSV
jgi:hypothetical protein